MAGSRAPERPEGRHERRNQQAALRSLGEVIPYSDEAYISPIPRLLRLLAVVVVVALIALAAVQWFRPVPDPKFESSTPGTLRLAGTAPSLPWPSMGAAALSMAGAGQIGSSGTTKPLPISGLVKVMTAYVVLSDHPLNGGASGPEIPVTAATLAAYQSEKADGESVVPVVAGESLTELEALQGIVVAGGNDLALMLADWDAGSLPAFVGKMNAAAHTLGLTSTRFVDPTGADNGSVSTPQNLIRLGEAAMAIPIFRTLVAMPQVSLPMSSVIYNLNFALGTGGVVGIKTGDNIASGASYLFEAQQVIHGSPVTLVGAVLDQQTVNPLAVAIHEGQALVQAAFGAVATIPALPPGKPLGTVVAPWGASVPVDSSTVPEVVGLPGTIVRVRVHADKLAKTLPPQTLVGQMTFVANGVQEKVMLRTTRKLGGPSVLWRLTRR